MCVKIVGAFSFFNRLKYIAYVEWNIHANVIKAFGHKV